MTLESRRLAERMQRAALRHLLVVAFLNAVVLAAVAILTDGSGRVRPACAGLAAIAIGGWPLARRERLASDLERVLWLALVGAAIGAFALAIDPDSRSTLFAAFLTPVGVCVLYGHWRRAVLAAAIVIGGYVVASAQVGDEASLESAISDTLPAVAVILGGLFPVRLALSTLDGRAESVAKWRAAASRTPAERTLGRPGISREHDAAILAGVRDGRSDKAIAFELGMGKASWRVRYRRRRLESEHGVRDRRELAKLLHRAPDGPDA